MTRAIGVSISAAATAAATFLLYTNLPVLAAQKGLAPTTLAAVVPALFGAAVAHQVVARGERVVLDRTWWTMWLFLALQLLATFSAEGFGVAMSRIGVFLAEGIVVYFLVRNAVRTLPGLRIAILAVLMSATLLAGLTVLQAATGMYDQDFFGLAQRNLEHLEGAPIPEAERMGLEDRARGPVDDPNRYAQILLMAAPLAFVAGLNAVSRRGAALALLSGAVVTAGVLLTYSRGAFLTLIVLVILCAPLRLVRPRRLAAILVAGVVLTPVAIPGYADRVASIAGVADLFGKGHVEADGPTRGRTTEMLAALAAYHDHPVLGVGPGQYLPYHSVRYQSLPEISFRELATPRRAHSLYLELAAESGTLGLVVFVAIPLLLLRDLWALRRSLSRHRPDLARLAAGFSLVLLAYLGTGVFLHLAFERYFWFMVGLTAAATGVLHRHARPTRAAGAALRGS